MKKYILFYFLTFGVFAQENPKVDSLEHLLNENNISDSSRLKILLQLTGETRFYDLKKAAVYASDAEQLALKTDQKSQYGRALYYEGMIHYYRGFLQLGIDYAEKAATVFEEINDLMRLSTCYELLGVIHTDMVNDEKAIGYLRKVLEIAEKQDDSFAQISANSNIGNIYLRQKNSKLARSYYQKAEALLRKTDEPSAFSEVYMNLAAVTDDRTEKLKLYDTARQGFEKNGMKEGKGQVLAAMGKDFMEQKKFDEAARYFQESIEAFQEFGFENGQAGTLILLAEAQASLGLSQNAESSALQAVRISSEKQLNEHLMNAYEFLSAFYEKLGNATEALKFFKLFSAQKEQNFNESKSKIIEENEAKYQSEKKELQLAEQTLQLSNEKSLRERIIWGSLIVFLLLAAAVAYYYFKQNQKRIAAENALKIQELESRNLREREQIKSAFFTNISHEFRTPLTLIVSPLNEMINGTFQGNQQSYFKIMLRNGQRLLELVNQLLDLAKLEVGSLQLHKEEGDINSFLKSIASSFESMAEIKAVRFLLTAPIGGIQAIFDKDKIQKILSNLLSNAFKFTPEGGEVRMEISQKQNDLQVDISDSGLGISKDNLPHIFERFYQVKDLNNTAQAGSGIGLALVKELVELHGGEIIVRSKEDEGTHFCVILPDILNQSSSASETIITEHSFNRAIEADNHQIGLKTNKPQVLVAEDHADVRRLISDVLSQEFDIVLAKDGQEALSMAQRLIPDAIVSDIMMPKMDGYAYCEALKTDPKTSHIPVILLTARAEQADKMHGLEMGADAYLPKPFDAAELKLRLKNLIELRQKLRQNFSKAISLKPEEMQVSSIDQQFIEQVKTIIEAHVSDEQFGVESFATEIGMSRSQLNRKLRAIFNQSANEMVRIYRLEKAHQLLTAKALTPTEASYQLGFSSPAYFSKCFSDHYGYPPSKVG